GIHNTDPFDVFDVAQGPDQCRQRIDLTEIFSVTRRILCDQDKLFYTLFRKIASLFNDRPEPPRTKRTAHRGDRTERTRPVAAFGDLDERGMRFRGPQPRRVFVVKISCGFVPDRRYREFFRVKFIVRRFENIVDLRGADESVDIGEFLHQIVAITLDQTAGNDDARRFAVAFQAGGLEYRVNRFLFCGFDEPAGVDHNRIRFVGIACDLIASFGKLSHHHLAVNEILGTPKTDKSYLLHKNKLFTDRLELGRRVATQAHFGYRLD